MNHFKVLNKFLIHEHKLSLQKHKWQTWEQELLEWEHKLLISLFTGLSSNTNGDVENILRTTGWIWINKYNKNPIFYTVISHARLIVLNVQTNNMPLTLLTQLRTKTHMHSYTMAQKGMWGECRKL